MHHSDNVLSGTLFDTKKQLHQRQRAVKELEKRHSSAEHELPLVEPCHNVEQVLDIQLMSKDMNLYDPPSSLVSGLSDFGQASYQLKRYWDCLEAQARDGCHHRLKAIPHKWARGQQTDRNLGWAQVQDRGAVLSMAVVIGDVIKGVMD